LRAAATGDVAAYFEANVAFHDRLVELAGNGKLLGMYRRLVNEFDIRSAVGEGTCVTITRWK